MAVTWQWGGDGGLPTVSSNIQPYIHTNLLLSEVQRHVHREGILLSGHGRLHTHTHTTHTQCSVSHGSGNRASEQDRTHLHGLRGQGDVQIGRREQQALVQTEHLQPLCSKQCIAAAINTRPEKNVCRPDLRSGHCEISPGGRELTHQVGTETVRPPSLTAMHSIYAAHSTLSAEVMTSGRVTLDPSLARPNIPFVPAACRHTDRHSDNTITNRIYRSHGTYIHTYIHTYKHKPHACIQLDSYICTHIHIHIHPKRA